MRNVIHDVEPGYAFLMEKINRVRILLAEYGHQYIGASNLFLSRRLDMQNRTLNHALKTKRRLGIYFASATDGRRIFA